VPLLPLPQPYDFHASTERFRSYGPDRANLWHEGGLHRVVAGHEVRIEAAPGGVRVEPWDDVLVAVVSHQLGLPFELERFWAWARSEPVLEALEEPLRGYRPPLSADPWEMLVTSITAQQVSLHSAFAVRSRLIERFGERHEVAWAFPARERIAAAGENEIREVGFSGRKAEYVIGLARSDRCLARGDAWPAGDLGVRKAVSHFYGEGRELAEQETREVGERFGPWRNSACHMLLAGRRMTG
jgi:DNA-3-methyladenine glycosylase II